MKPDAVSEALHHIFVSPNECDSNGEAANVVDGLFALARAIRFLAAEVKAGLLAVANAAEARKGQEGP